jgi:membrane protein implicated in regulation of membrane protease activity
VKVGGILFIVLGIFVLTAGIVYGIWGYELAGTFYLTVLGVAFMYLAHVLLHAAKEEPRETEDEYATVPGDEAGGHGTQALSREALEPVPVTAHASPPALTPFLFAVAGTFIMLGLVFTKWLVIVGAIIVASVAIAWLLETAPRRTSAVHGEHGEAEVHGETIHEDAPAATQPAPSPTD